MEDPYFATPAWNSSFEDNDASTTLDTSVETINDSVVDSNSCKVVEGAQGDHFGLQNLHHQHKYPISRSSPGAPLAKEYHNAGGYFDDIESFTSRIIPLQYDNDVSPRTLHPSLSTQYGRKHHQKGSSVDTAIPGDDQRIISPGKRHGTHPGDDLDFSGKAQAELIALKHSSPMLSAASIPTSDFASTRRSSRSHTCQGIPSHILLNGLESINEIKGGGFADQHVELQTENETLRSELENTRSRLSELEEHMSLLAVRFEQDARKETLIKNGTTSAIPAPTSNPMLNFPMPPFTVGGLVPAGPAHFIDTRGHGTPDTSSLTSMSMTPDPFSPFQRFHSNYPKTGAHGNAAGEAFLGQRHGNIGGHDIHLHGGVSIDKQSSESRFERSNRAAMQDLQMPVELLVAKTMGPRSQDASIALQQQLKTSSPARKTAIVEAMASHVVRLSEDKHGNFLVQRAIGVDARVAWELKGHFVDLSLSQFGCHVVQRVLDEESMQATVVEELLSKRILDTLTCRNSIHVWQKVLEINWADRKIREKIFSVINTVMKGRWAETAMQETGSIICQNIFESADGPEKEDCVTEILARLCECAANQWGVWVVQHIIEHGEGEHRRIAFDTLLSNAVNLTLSQYGQKAIMSALKSHDTIFINAYIDLLCDRDTTSGPSASLEAPSTPGAGPVMTNTTTNTRRSVLVDISSAPQGVQIITQLLTSVQPGQRDRIIKAVRKNSVFLKGSKAGLRVHQLCERARAFTGY